MSTEARIPPEGKIDTAEGYYQFILAERENLLRVSRVLTEIKKAGNRYYGQAYSNEPIPDRVNKSEAERWRNDVKGVRAQASQVAHLESDMSHIVTMAQKLEASSDRLVENTQHLTRYETSAFLPRFAGSVSDTLKLLARESATHTGKEKYTAPMLVEIKKAQKYLENVIAPVIGDGRDMAEKIAIYDAAMVERHAVPEGEHRQHTDKRFADGVNAVLASERLQGTNPWGDEARAADMEQLKATYREKMATDADFASREAAKAKKRGKASELA